jgi:hypothetical protein
MSQISPIDVFDGDAEMPLDLGLHAASDMPLA